MIRDENNLASTRARLKAKLTAAETDVNGTARLLSKFDPSRTKAYRGERTKESMIAKWEKAKADRDAARKNLEQFDLEHAEEMD